MQDGVEGGVPAPDEAFVATYKLPDESNARPSGQLICVCGPAIVMTGATFPLALMGYAVMLFPAPNNGVLETYKSGPVFVVVGPFCGALAMLGGVIPGEEPLPQDDKAKPLILTNVAKSSRIVKRRIRTSRGLRPLGNYIARIRRAYQAFGMGQFGYSPAHRLTITLIKALEKLGRLWI